MTYLMQAIIYNSQIKKWCRFERPIFVLQADTLSDVRSVIQRAEQAVNAQNLYAAGFVCYEAASAFDPDLPVRQRENDLPYAVFGLFDEPEYLSRLPEPPVETDLTINWRMQIDQNRYMADLSVIREKLRQGDTYQVNYTYRLTGSFSGCSESLFYQLMANQPTAYGAFFELDNWAICSASPELFFSRQGDIVTCKPMKGTASRGLDYVSDKQKAAELHKSAKCRAENVMIVDMVRNDLGHFAVPGTVRVPELFTTSRYPTLWQMTSTVECQTNAGLADIFAGLFPCASITGAPKQAAMAIISELESSPRGIYCGAAGMIDEDGNCSFNVAIRTVLVDKRRQQAIYGSGGGIVWDSCPQAEFEEAKLKAAMLTTRVRNDFQILETMLYEPGKGIFLLERHLQRMADSSDYFAWKFDPAQARELLHNTAESSISPLRIRLLCDKNGKLTIETAGFTPTASGTIAKVVLADHPVDKNDVFLYHKTTCRAVYERAKASAAPGIDDVILYNQQGEITESTIANIVIEKDGKKYTPPVSCGLLPGTYRDHLLNSGELTEKIITISELKSADKIILINSVRTREAVLS